MSELDETPTGQAALPPAVPAIQRAARAYRRASVFRACRNSASEWTGLRILCYHRISTQRDVLSVSPETLRRQLEYAVGSGAKAVRLSDALRAGTTEQGGRAFCVTFDDGYEDTLSAALPVLQDMQIPATVYLATAITSGTAQLTWYRTPPPMLDWDGVEQLRSCGLVDVGAHSRTHPALPRIDDAASRAEIFGSREEIAARLGVVPTSFAYPAGLYGERERELVIEAGYTSAVTVRTGVNAADADPFALARTIPYGEESIGTFAARFDGKLDVQTRLRSFVLNRSRAHFFRFQNP